MFVFINKLLFVIMLMFTGCNTYFNRVEKLVVDDFYIEANNTLVISFYQYNDRKNLHYAQFNTTTQKWETITRDKFIFSQQTLFQDNEVEYKKNQETIFLKQLPTVQELELVINQKLQQDSLVYTAYREKQNFQWDEKTYIASVSSQDRQTVFHFAVEEQEDETFKIYLIDSSVYSNLSSLFYDNSSHFITQLTRVDEYSDKFTAFKLSTDEKASFCYYKPQGGLVCFVREDNTIVSKSLFGDLYLQIFQEYYDILTLKQDPVVSIIFDKNGNMYLFDSDENILNIQYFTKENPTTPLYEQKIVWEE